MKNDIKNHYDKFIEINNDPVNDCEELKKHMNKWDGNILLKNYA